MSGKDGDDNKWTENYPFFMRRYLGNQKSYRDEWKIILKLKVSRLW